jgi:hypothetical protein
VKGTPARVGCSSRFCAPSRVEPNSGALESIASNGWFHQQGTPGDPLQRSSQGFRPYRPPREDRLAHSQVARCSRPPTLPFRFGQVKSVKRKRDLFPGLRTTSQRSFGVAACRAPLEPTAQRAASPTKAFALARSTAPQSAGAAPSPPFQLRNINRIPFRYGFGACLMYHQPPLQPNPQRREPPESRPQVLTKQHNAVPS